MRGPASEASPHSGQSTDTGQSIDLPTPYSPVGYHRVGETYPHHHDLPHGDPRRLPHSALLLETLSRVDHLIAHVHSLLTEVSKIMPAIDDLRAAVTATTDEMTAALTEMQDAITQITSHPVVQGTSDADLQALTDQLNSATASFKTAIDSLAAANTPAPSA